MVIGAGVTVVNGSPTSPSRTTAAAVAVCEAIAANLAELNVGHHEFSVERIDCLAIAHHLFDHTSTVLQAALETAARSQVIVVGSPTYKGSYTGLVKAFLDRMPRDALVGVVAVPLMTFRDPRHSGAVDRSLAPVLEELGATCVVPGLRVLDAPEPEAVVEAAVALMSQRWASLHEAIEAARSRAVP